MRKLIGRMLRWFIEPAEVEFQLRLCEFTPSEIASLADEIERIDAQLRSPSIDVSPARRKDLEAKREQARVRLVKDSQRRKAGVYRR